MQMKAFAAAFLALVVVVQGKLLPPHDDPSEHEPEGQGNTLGAPGTWDYCKGTPKCVLGESDCDSDNECEGDLVCGLNNCKAMFPDKADSYDILADCCDTIKPFHLDYCNRAPHGKCKYGEGTCNTDSHCDDGLVCGGNCRAMHPTVPYHTIYYHATCCSRCGGAATVTGSGSSNNMHTPASFVEGKVVSAERTLSNPPPVLAAAAVYNLPALVSGDKIELECCASKGEPCNFFVAVYHCPPCSHKKNGGIPAFLASEGWMGSSCAPIFTPTGSSQSQTMTVFHKTLAAGEVFDIPVTGDAPHVAVFSTTQTVGRDWCPAKAVQQKTTTGPNRPCVCLE